MKGQRAPIRGDIAMGTTYRPSRLKAGLRSLSRSAVAGASGIATAGRTERPTARVASHLDPLSAPGTGPHIRVVREGRDGSQSHPGMNVPFEEIDLHEFISANGHVVPPSRLLAYSCTPWSRRLIRPTILGVCRHVVAGGSALRNSAGPRSSVDRAAVS